MPTTEPSCWSRQIVSSEQISAGRWPISGSPEAARDRTISLLRLWSACSRPNAVGVPFHGIQGQ